MFYVDPNQLIGMIKQGYNPQQLVMSVLENQMKGTPMGENLLNLARTGQTSEIEKIARNLVAQRGLDFDTEFAKFKAQYGFK